MIGILIGLTALILLAYKGHSIIWVAPVCAIIVAVLGGLNILSAYLGDYIGGTAAYVVSCSPHFSWVLSMARSWTEPVLPVLWPISWSA